MSKNIQLSEELKKAVWLIRGGQSPDAIPILDRLLEVDPNDWFARRERGFAKMFTDDHAGAIADYTANILAQPENADRYADRAAALQRAGDLNGAVDDYTAAVQLDPRHKVAYFQRGRVKMSMGDLHGAIEDFTIGMAFDSIGPLSGLLNRGVAKHRLGDLTGAIDDLTEAMRLERGLPLHAPLYRGRVRVDARDYVGAITDFTTAIEAYPGLTNAYRHRAEAKALAGDLVGAQMDLRAYERLGGKDLPAYA